MADKKAVTVFESLLNNTGTAYRRRRTPDGQGGWVIDYVEVGTSECRIRPATSSERTVAQQEERQISHVLYVAVDADIVRGDRFYVDDIVVDIKAERKPSQENDYLNLEHLEFDCLEHQAEENVEDGS